MATTQKTEVYKLPIVSANDKPTWQGDFNDLSNGTEAALNAMMIRLVAVERALIQGGN